MKFTILILSSAALALAGPIIPTMICDLPTISTSTNELVPTYTFFPRPMRICPEETKGQPHIPCIPRQLLDPPDEHREPEPEESEVAARALTGRIIPTVVPDSELLASPTSTDEPVPTTTTIEDFLESLVPQGICARGEPPSRYPHGCCDWVAGNCIPHLHDPPYYTEHELEESIRTTLAFATPVIPTVVPESELASTTTSTDESLPTMNIRGGS